MGRVRELSKFVPASAFEVNGTTLTNNWDEVFTNPRRADEIADRLSKHIPSTISGPVVEAGCSVASTTERFQELYPQASVFGFDIHPWMKYSPSEHKSKYCVANFYRMPFREKSITLLMLPNNLLWLQENVLPFLLLYGKELDVPKVSDRVMSKVPLVGMIAYFSQFIQDGGWLVLEKDSGHPPFNDMMLLAFQVNGSGVKSLRVLRKNTVYGPILAGLVNKKMSTLTTE